MKKVVCYNHVESTRVVTKLVSFFNMAAENDNKITSDSAAPSEDMSHLFWVPARIHPQLAPDAFQQWLASVTDNITSSSGSTATLVRKKSAVITTSGDDEHAGDAALTIQMPIIDVADDLGQYGAERSSINAALQRRVSLTFTPGMLEKIAFNGRTSPIRPHGSTLKRSVRTRTVRSRSDTPRTKTLRSVASFPDGIDETESQVQSATVNGISSVTRSESPPRKTSATSLSSTITMAEPPNTISPTSHMEATDLGSENMMRRHSDILFSESSKVSRKTSARMSTLSKIFRRDSERSIVSAEPKAITETINIMENKNSNTVKTPPLSPSSHSRISVFGRLFGRSKPSVFSDAKLTKSSPTLATQMEDMYQSSAVSSTSSIKSDDAPNISPLPQRFPIHLERSLYKLSHLKLSNPRRPLHQQVMISNLMYWYLGIVGAGVSQAAKTKSSASPMSSHYQAQTKTTQMATSQSALPEALQRWPQTADAVIQSLSPVSKNGIVPFHGIPGASKSRQDVARRMPTPVANQAPEVLVRRRIGESKAGR